MNSACPLCGISSSYLENQHGLHCEGLLCANCGCNARNRFFYYGLNRIISKIKYQSASFLKVLEASSYGYAQLRERYLDQMRLNNVEMICSDFNEGCFKAAVKENLSSLSFKNDSLDIICHSHVLEHVEDDLAAIQDSMRCLKNGGVLLIAVPVQTDFTFQPDGEYHGDNAYVFRRNGWDLIDKLKLSGFHVKVLVPPEHPAVNVKAKTKPADFVIDDIRFSQKFSQNFIRFSELFYSICSEKESIEQKFSPIWGQLELFVSRKLS